LREGAKGRYVYRGQTKEYLSPLVPSLFRPTVSSDTQHIPWFGETLRAINSAQFVKVLPPEQVYTRITRDDALRYARRLHVGDYMLQALGYPLSQIFSQQAGLHSEGLDVTKDLDVAIFFATHSWDGQRYRHVEQDGIGIIYRWPIHCWEITIDRLNGIDFYTCPPLP
jgi:hypothetical protein